MFVVCLHYSNTYPTGGQSVGDIFYLTPVQFLHYKSIGWVRKLTSKECKDYHKDSDKLVTGAVDLSKGNHSIRKR